MDLREICELKEMAAYEDMRNTFEIEVVKELRVIGNLDEVLEDQIPEIIRIIRNRAEEFNEL